MISKMLKASKLYCVCVVCVALIFVLAACSNEKKLDANTSIEEINLFVASSLTSSIEEIIQEFEKENPNTKVIVNADSSGKLKTQILEGFDCDLFFSASSREVDELIKANLIKKEDSVDVLENNLAIIGFKNSEYKIENLADIQSVNSIALAYGSVPVGFYTRKALIAEGILNGAYDDKESIKAITGVELADALGSVMISEQANASTTITAVAEKSTDIGFAYTSDVNRNENTKIILKISKDLTGEIVYPLANIKPSAEISKEHIESVQKLFEYLQSEKAKVIYKKYGFSAI